jgi:hypothetical protein
MRRFQGIAAGFVLVVSIGSLQGCGGASDGQVSPEFKKADLRAQDAMKELMPNNNKAKPKTKSKSKSTSSLTPAGGALKAGSIARRA